MISRRTRSRTGPGSNSNSGDIKIRPSLRPNRRKTDPTTINRQCKNTTHGQQQQISTPMFTWDVPKTQKQDIYEDLGVKEMDIGGTVDRTLVHGASNNARTSRVSKNKGSGDVEEVKDHLGSPDQFKPHLEHVPKGHTCSCKKQLLLEKSGDPFYRLSDEIMLGIFCWLPLTQLARCARVCKHWCHLVFDDALWRRINLSTKIFLPGVLGQILSRGTTAAKLSRCAIQGSVFESLNPELTHKETRSRIQASKGSKSDTAITSQSVLHLQYLDLTASDTKPHQLAEIIHHCPSNQIKKLSLESCAVNDGVMTCVADHGGSLEELNLCMCSGLTEAGLRRVLESCTRLRSLNLAWTNLSQKAMETFLETVPRDIEKLNLSGCRQTLKTFDVVSLACRCPSIKELDLSDATLIGFAAIDAIIDHMTELQHIALSRCYSIPQLSFVQLSTLEHLRALDIFGLVNEVESLESMKELLPGIQINVFPFSAIARPTTTKKRNNIWEVSCYE